MDNTTKKQPQVKVSNNRVIVYIDGFNLYFGMREGKLRNLYWLDMVKFSRRLLKEGQSLAAVKYFTARISGLTDEAKRLRQKMFLDALATLDGLRIITGLYQPEPIECRHCHVPFDQDNEKMTDVKLSLAMVADAQDDKFDTAILVSGDSDQVPTIQYIKTRYPTKRVIVYFPPNRPSHHLKQEAHGVMHVDELMLRNSQMDDPMLARDGKTKLFCPDHWRRTGPIVIGRE